MQAVTLESPARPALAGRHSPAVSVLLHLLPGALIGAAYFLLAGPVARLGLPSIVALMAAGVLALVPVELGIIAWAARSAHPRPLAFRELLAYRERLPAWNYLVWPLVIFMGAGLVMTLLTPVSAGLHGLFAWLPARAQLDLGLSGGTARATLLWVTAFNALLVAFVLPLVEELYFRGFLLPRMPASLGRWTPLAHSLLFAAYHFWSPWMIVARTFGLLPLVLVVQRKRSLALGIIAHVLLNLLDVFAMIAFLAGG